MWIGGLLEWFLGNTFSFVVFFFYGEQRISHLSHFHLHTADCETQAASCLAGERHYILFTMAPGHTELTGHIARVWQRMDSGQVWVRHSLRVITSVNHDTDMICFITAFWPVAAGMISFVFMIGASRINAVFVMVFLSIGLGFLLLAAAFWEQALGDADMYDTLLQVRIPIFSIIF